MYQSADAENVVVLNNGLQFQEASASSTEMQLNESKRTLSDEINGIFHISDDFDKTFKLAIYPIVKAFETALNRDLLLEKEKKNHYFEFDVKEIVRASLKERYEAYKLAKETGFMTVNEIRRAENMNWIEGMDVINVGLGAVLYDVNTHKYYTPNTDSVSSPNDESVPAGGEDEAPTEMGDEVDNTIEALGTEEDSEIEETLDGLEAELLGGVESRAEDEMVAVDFSLDDLEEELLGGFETRAYASKYYDPVKAHEYYEQHKKLKGRKSTAGLNDKGKASAMQVKAKLDEQKKSAIASYKDAMNRKIDAIRARYKGMSTNDKKKYHDYIFNQIKALREEHKAKKAEIKAQYDDEYVKELNKMKDDKSMRQGGTSTSMLSDTGKARAKAIKEKLTQERNSAIAQHKERMNRAVEDLRTRYKSLSKEQKALMHDRIYGEIKALRERNKADRTQIKKDFDQRYVKELNKLKADTSMRR